MSSEVSVAVECRHSARRGGTHFISLSTGMGCTRYNKGSSMSVRESYSILGRATDLLDPVVLESLLQDFKVGDVLVFLVGVHLDLGHRYVA